MFLITRTTLLCYDELDLIECVYMIDYKTIATKISERYSDYPDLLGIIWVGSSSFGIVDKLTDIDIRLIVDHTDKRSAMQQFVYDGIKIEVDEISWSWLTSDLNLDSDKRWIREKAIILFDPSKRLISTFETLKKKIYELNKQAVWQSYKSLFFEYEVKKCITREDLITASLYTYKAIENLLKFIYLYHNDAVPPFKWRWYFIKKNRLLSPMMIRQILQMLETRQTDNSRLLFLRTLEVYVKQLMLKKGYSKVMVDSPWLY